MKKKREKRKKIITDRLFNKLWMAAEKADSKNNYIQSCTDFSSEQYVNFRKQCGLKYEEGLDLLNEIYDKQHMSFKEILEVAGKRKADIANSFCIPIRTVEDWYTEKNKCSGYIRLMLLRQYHILNLGKYISTEHEEEYIENIPKIYEKNIGQNGEQNNELDYSQSSEEDDETLQDIDNFLETLKTRRKEIKIEENTSIRNLMEKTSFIDEIFKR